MATMRLAFSAVFLVLGWAKLGMAWKESGVIHVSGKVVCQDCTKPYNEWVKGDRPIKGCKVSLTCTDDRGRVTHYDSDETDDQGQFDIIVSKYLNNGKKLKEKSCKVRIVSSPDPTCNVLTNFGSGKSGVYIERPTSVYRDSAKYVVGPFYCTTPMCEQPDTTQPQEAGFAAENHHP